MQQHGINILRLAYITHKENLNYRARQYLTGLCCSEKFISIVVVKSDLEMFV